MPRSEFTYDRSLLRDVARVLADARVRVWSDAQLHTIDMVISDLCDEFAAADPHFDSEDFTSRCRAHQGRLPPLII